MVPAGREFSADAHEGVNIARATDGHQDGVHRIVVSATRLAWHAAGYNAAPRKASIAIQIKNNSQSVISSAADARNHGCRLGGSG